MPPARQDKTPWQQGHIYHIYNRGAHQQTIFREEANYIFVLKRLKKYIQQYNLSLLAYCLMPNHYHLLIRQNSNYPAGYLPQYTFNSYTKAYNKQYGHSGTLFQGRYQAKLVNSERYLRHLCRYIHANPAKDGLVSAPEAWPYSNYLEWIGERKGSLVERDFIKTYFPNTAEYIAFVTDFLLQHQEIKELDYLQNF